MSDGKKSILESGDVNAASPDKTARIAPGLSAAAPSAKKPLTNTQRAVMAIVSVAAVAIIAVSASFLFAPGGETSDPAALFETTQQESSDEGDAASSEPASDSSETSDGASSDNSVGETSDASGQEASETSEAVQTGTETVVTSDAGGGQAASSGASSQSAPAPESNRDVVTITVSVTSAAVGNPVSAGPVQFSFDRGATALDALVATGLSVNASSSPFGGVYVSAIGGLAEDTSKGAWGWKYSVNGADPQMSSGLYTLNDGDVVAWRYVTDING